MLIEWDRAHQLLKTFVFLQYFAVLGETYVAPDEKITDSLYKWEKWSQVNTSPSNRDLRLIFKVNIWATGQKENFSTLV